MGDRDRPVGLAVRAEQPAEVAVAAVGDDGERRPDLGGGTVGAADAGPTDEAAVDDRLDGVVPVEQGDVEDLGEGAQVGDERGAGPDAAAFGRHPHAGPGARRRRTDGTTRMRRVGDRRRQPDTVDRMEELEQIDAEPSRRRDGAWREQHRRVVEAVEAIDDRDVASATCEFGGGREAGGTAADDQDVDVGGGGSGHAVSVTPRGSLGRRRAGDRLGADRHDALDALVEIGERTARLGSAKTGASSEHHVSYSSAYSPVGSAPPSVSARGRRPTGSPRR
ncbi:MAG: hypothetical protein R2705_21885 [Ilumatobacteraceae bacterium]